MTYNVFGGTLNPYSGCTSILFFVFPFLKRSLFCMLNINFKALCPQYMSQKQSFVVRITFINCLCVAALATELLL